MSAAPRFTTPAVAPPAPVSLPAIERSTLANGLRVWTLPHAALPVVALSLLVDVGTADDPADLPGLAAIATDMLDEAPGDRDAIHFAEALADLGATLDLGASPDATSVQLWTVRHHLAGALQLAADALTRPRFRDTDLARVRDIRLSRLQQSRRSAAAAADRAFTAAVYGTHGYGHPGIGTSSSLSRITIDDVQRHYAQRFGPDRVTLIAAGDVRHDDVVTLATEAFGHWAPIGSASTRQVITVPFGAPRVLFVEREGAPQSELRVGHVAVPRLTPEYHALVLLNAGIGGSFSGRLNQRLRQQLGYTYGARSSFDLDRDAGMFVCETSVQGDRTAASLAEIREMLVAARTTRPLEGDELDLARGSLTSGYARSFETPRQLVGALAQVAVYGIADDAFNTYVPKMQAVTAAAVQQAAVTRIDPDRLVAVVVGDPQWRDALGDSVETVAPEF